MIRAWRASRAALLVLSLLFCLSLFGLGRAGLLAPLEELAALPLNIMSGAFNRVVLSLVEDVEDLAELQSLRARVAELEETLADYQAELVELRELASDYGRIARLLEYTTATAGRDFVAADVINVDHTGLRRTIAINRGARDGIAAGMPVVTDQGLVGRVLQPLANVSRVLLITDRDSAVSARLQGSRAEGSLLGQLSGNLRLSLVPQEETVRVGDLVLTSGLGGNFPPDIVMGQVTSSRQFEFELFQEAEVTSFIRFEMLEQVLVMTGFEAVDPIIFDESEG